MPITEKMIDQLSLQQGDLAMLPPKAHGVSACLRDGKHWQYGASQAGNAIFAWVQHIVHHGPASGSSGAGTTCRFGVA